MFDTIEKTEFNIQPIRIKNKLIYPCARCKGTGMITNVYGDNEICPVCNGKKIIRIKIK